MSIYSLYRITNLVNGKVYIGCTTASIQERFYAHKQAAARGSNLPIHHAIRKYGVEHFSIVQICSALNKDAMYELERHFIVEYDCCRLDGDKPGYNLTRGGEGFDSETARALINRRTANGTNPWAGPLGSAHSKALSERLKAEGRHPTQNPDWVEARANEVRERVRNGTHHWLGDEWGEKVRAKQKELVDSGSHHFQSEAHKRKIKERIESGEHYFTKKASCVLRQRSVIH